MSAVALIAAEKRTLGDFRDGPDPDMGYLMP